jgi:hypothetical protein
MGKGTKFDFAKLNNYKCAEFYEVGSDFYKKNLIHHLFHLEYLEIFLKKFTFKLIYNLKKMFQVQDNMMHLKNLEMKIQNIEYMIE